MFPLFKIKETEFSSFKRDIDDYCRLLNYHDFILVDAELLQLMWTMGNSYVTPEARGANLADKLHFEIKRGLARRYGFELLLRGDEGSYQEFVQAQRAECRLSVENFKKLSQEAISLNPDAQAIIRVSCLLTISDKEKKVLEEGGYAFSNDSEDFLSDIAVILQKNQGLFPITPVLTQNQLALLEKAFWPTMHLRHMIYTEGGMAMTSTFSAGVRTGKLNADDFKIWQWRWLTNLFGFQAGPAAKYYDSEVHQLVGIVITELENILISPDYSYLDNYLVKRAELAGFNHDLGLSKNDQLLLGHVIAYFNQITIITPDLGRAVLLAYQYFKLECQDTGQLAELYNVHSHNPDTITPTYVPAIINTAYVIFKKIYAMADIEAIKNATQFMCQFLKALYALSSQQRISCMEIAKEPNLKLILESWLGNHQAIEFMLMEDLQMKVQLSPTVSSYLSMS